LHEARKREIIALALAWEIVQSLQTSEIGARRKQAEREGVEVLWGVENALKSVLDTSAEEGNFSSHRSLYGKHSDGR
jgi:hypothetical protein